MAIRWFPPAAVSVNLSIFAKMLFDALRDLAAISQAAESANVLVAALRFASAHDQGLDRARQGKAGYAVGSITREQRHAA